MNRYYLILLFSLVFLIFPPRVLAESSYVLPYPSAMPGSIFYKLNLIQEGILKYWYFGDFAQFKYNLKESDKYLVEAKTLFDYKQYLLGFDALKKSDMYFKNIKPEIESAEKNDKNVTSELDILSQASSKHIEELLKMQKSLPQSFLWSPEKQKSQNLEIGRAIDTSISIRK